MVVTGRTGILWVATARQPTNGRPSGIAIKAAVFAEALDPVQP
jgi:hypothetical protein